MLKFLNRISFFIIMNFNWEIYRALNPDLIFSHPKDYLIHFQKYGIKQHRHFSIYNLAKKFNSRIYKYNYIDLHNLNEIQLQLHYILKGQYQLRIYDRLIKPIDGLIFENKLEDSTYFDFIDKIFYINLDSRSDRLKEIEFEFDWSNIPNEKIERFSAIKYTNGAIGCSSSHIA